MSDELARVRIWDLPTRLFHWSLAGLVVASIVCAKLGGGAMAWHFRLGYAIFALLVFRLLWGVIGGHWSRFSSFLYSPSTVARYVRRQHRADEHLGAGHTPLGALSVFAMLAVLALQVGTGLFSDDEIANTGPLIRLVSDHVSLALTKWHRLSGTWLIVGAIALHVAAIAVYRVNKRLDLVGPMIHGDKPLGHGVPASVDTRRTRWRAVLAMAASAGLVAWVIGLGN